jgi:hypothetical protein
MDPRMIAVVLAQQTAMRIVKSHVRKQGRIRISEVSHAMWTKLARDYLSEHRELIDAELAGDLCWQLARPKRQRPMSINQITPNPALRSLKKSETETAI